MVDSVRLRTVCRALRIKKGWRQADVAQKASLRRAAISLLESGRVSRLRVETVMRIIEVLGGNIDFVVRWRGGELDRLLNARHSALHESVARHFGSFREWVIVPEVSFAIRGEHGIIDILAWHATTRIVLVIELKTDVVDFNELMGTLDKKRRLAPLVAVECGWRPISVGVWVIVADGVRNRRRVRSHSATLRAAFPSDGRSADSWLAKPAGELRCLSFWSNAHDLGTKTSLAAVRRVRPPKSQARERADRPRAAG